jgi:octanoyl-[GcvH]:protein N-octanoyltransferase
VKLVGIAQRAVRGAALVTAFVQVGGGARLRSALVDVYSALELEWDPATAGALDDVLSGASVADVEQAILATRGRDLAVDTVDEPTLALGRELEARHRWA